jgi:F-type H+-transporting ATPase subunit b
MLIDWFTVGAQALNFVVLVWLLKHFLYKPVLDAIDAREKQIAAQLADAEAKKAEAKKERDAFQRKNDDFDQQRAALLAKATGDADAQRQQLIAQARSAADALAAKRRETLASEARSLNQALRQRAQTEVFAVARRALADLATASLEASACETFIARLRALEGPARDALADALKAPAGPVLVRSAFELPAAQRSAVQEAIQEIFAMKVDLDFETAPALVSGIELSTRGQKFAWSIGDYLASLEREVDALLTPPPPSPAPAPSPPASPAPALSPAASPAAEPAPPAAKVAPEPGPS